MIKIPLYGPGILRNYFYLLFIVVSSTEFVEETTDDFYLLSLSWPRIPVCRDGLCIGAKVFGF